MAADALLQSIAENGGLLKVASDRSTSSQPAKGADGKWNEFGILDPPYPFDKLGEIYELNNTYRKCIEFKATNVVAAGWEIVPFDEKKAKDAEKKELEDFLMNCNDENTFEELVKAMLIDKWSYGDGAIELAREGLNAGARRQGKPSKLFHIPVETLRVMKGDTDGTKHGKGGFRTGERFVMIEDWTDKIAVWFNRYQPDPEKRTPENGYNEDMNGGVRTNELLWFKQPNPRSKHYGLPPAITLFNDILLGRYAQQYNLNEFETGMLARFMVIVKNGQLKKESIEALQQYISELVTQGKASAIPILSLMSKDGDVKIEKLSAEIKEMSYLDLLKYIRSEVWVALGVPPMLLGIPDASFKNTATEEERKFYEKEIIPEQQYVAARFTKMFGQDFGYDNWYLRWKTPTLRDEQVQSEVNERKLKSGVMTINQWRGLDGLEDVTGGDVPMIWTTQGLIPVSQLPALEGADLAEAQGETAAKSFLGRLRGAKVALENELTKREIVTGTDDGEKDTPYPDGATAE